MVYKFIIILFFIVLNQNVAFTQENKEVELNTFTSDGQEYFIRANKINPSTIHVIFYPEFIYKIKLIPENNTSVIELKIKDFNNKLIYSNNNHNFTKEWQFTFQSLLNANLELKLLKCSNKEETIRVQITFQRKKNN